MVLSDMEKQNTENGVVRSGGERPTVRQSSSTRLLVSLIVLFALTTVALSVVLAVTVLKVKDDDDAVADHASVLAAVQPTTATPTEPHHASVVAAVQPTTATPTSITHDDVCLTEGCVLAAARVRSAMDESAKPCEDFYQFACGSWLRQHVIPSDKARFGVFTKLRDDVSVILKYVLEATNHPADPEVVHTARNYYRACMNEDKIEARGLTNIHQYMATLGGWPVMGNNDGGHYNDSQFNLEDMLIYARHETNSAPLVDFGVLQDVKNPTIHQMAIDQPSLGMPSRDYYLKGRNDKMLMAYQKMLMDIAVAFGADESSADQYAKDMVDFEIEIANITVPKEDRRDPTKMYNMMKISDMGKNFTRFDWGKYVTTLMAGGNVTVSDDDMINMMAPAYFEKLFSVLRKYPNRTIANYIVGQHVVSKTFYLPAQFTDISLAYSKVLSGTGTRAPRWRDCAVDARDHFPEVVGRLFVQDAFHKDAKDDVLDLIGKLKESFGEMIGELEWMDKVTKSVAKEKLDYIEPRIGYPDVVYDEAKLNDRYTNITIIADDPMRNIINVGRDEVNRNLRLINKPYDKDSWGMSSAEVNAYYSPPTNQITFPAAILQPPFYAKSQPAYLNYGGIGFVIGHEMTHGFDDTGRLYNKLGNLQNWWLDKDARMFKARAQCIVDQYSNFTVPGTGGMTLNGVNTQGENIADNGGIKESFLAYRKWVAARGKEEAKLPGLPYTSNQLYFLNAAQVWCDKARDGEKKRRIYTDPHSMPMFRVYGPMQNFDEFSKAFNCPAGSYMNRADRCSVW